MGVAAVDRRHLQAALQCPEPGPSDHGELDDALYRLTGRLLEEETAAAAESLRSGCWP
jgi:hypothetical protein